MSEQIILQATWQPRWYYVMRNKTSGKKYAGQTVRENMDKYCGSGKYWTNHCKKHGGRGRQNIEVLEQIWVADKVQAQEWLDAFAAENGKYWLRENTIWANACKETTGDSAFLGVDWSDPVMAERRKEISKIAGKIALESGQFKKYCAAGGKVVGKIQGKKNLETGHWANCQALANKKNMESGQFKRFCSAGGKASGETKRLKTQFCKFFGISNPGNNFKNIDKAAFQAWKESLT